MHLSYNEVITVCERAEYNPSWGQYKTRTADYGLRTTDWVQNTDSGIKRGLSITDWV